MPVIVIAPWDTQCSLCFSSLPVSFPFLLRCPLFSSSNSPHHPFIWQARRLPSPREQILTRAGETKTNSEGLAEEVASLSPPYFPNLTPLFPPHQPHLTHQTVIRTFILPSIFFSDTLQFSHPSKGLCLLKETHLGWGKRDRREGDIGVR